MRMINVAILGFGVVGGGVADLLTNNSDCVSRLGGDEINIKYLLDLRDFPDSPFADRVVHDFDIILSDPEVSCVIEVMGGSHPAYEYTVAALKAGKSVITSNKEVVAAFGDEFLSLAAEHGACYRFEAAVGGGIPVISPMISFIGQNRLREVRGILNGTTNYILTKMFSYGASFEESLKDAQDRGYAERNPDADVLGTDACRKITILTALATGKLLPTDSIHTEGITAIRKEDVIFAEKIGMKIKLLGRCILTDNGIQAVVAPFMIHNDSPLSTVSGVYNAVEVIGDPIGNVMFYGQGAGAGATASAVVGDLMQIMRSGRSYAEPCWTKTDDGLLDFACFEARNYVALDGVTLSEVNAALGEIQLICDEGELAFITGVLSESEISEAIEKLTTAGATIKSRIRLV
ncbi:MAG: homoserine dehydrogenase [Clostridia bacterium]|nr:homoserine dehydrogenase [Clostridia bacterium]